jgi:AhpD family alkylhydroperoxidase
MKKRLSINQVVPAAYSILLEMEKFLAKSPLNKNHYTLIKLRSSQINGCAFCLHMHLQEALRVGEDINRVTLLSAWEEAGTFFDEKERAVLALTEAITLISKDGLPDEIYEKCITLFGEPYTAHLILAIVSINSWNRIARSSRTAPGEKVPVSTKATTTS